jgi:hypothetical protein
MSDPALSAPITPVGVLGATSVGAIGVPAEP